MLHYADVYGLCARIIVNALGEPESIFRNEQDERISKLSAGVVAQNFSNYGPSISELNYGGSDAPSALIYVHPDPAERS